MKEPSNPPRSSFPSIHLLQRYTMSLQTHSGSPQGKKPAGQVKIEATEPPSLPPVNTLVSALDATLPDP
jgi:hypothetical protein